MFYLTKKKKVLWAIPIFTFSLGGCVSMMYEDIPFTDSSLDFNDGKPFVEAIKTSSVEETLRDVTKLMKERGFFIIGKKCDDGRCQAEYKSDPSNKTITIGSTYGSTYDGTGSTQGNVSTANMERSSKIFLKARELNGSVQIALVGVPILNQHMSCPEYVAQNLEKCSPEPLVALRGKTLAESVRQQWGYDVSGRTEAEVIKGVLAELQ